MTNTPEGYNLDHIRSHSEIFKQTLEPSNFKKDKMNEITIVSYLRKNETINKSFYELVNTFQMNHLLCRVVIFSDVERTDFPLKYSLVVDQGRTKYARLKKLITSGQDLYILSIDSDITLSIESSIEFCKNFIQSDSSIGWGHIGVSNYGVVPNMVSIDKILSHNYIRPLLWDLHCGISIPGQFFIIRRHDYEKILIPDDTFLDDLQIGLITKKAKFKVFRPAIITGREYAKETLKDLFQQRKRWAKGYSSILKTAFRLSTQHFSLVVIHGMFYHVLFPLLIAFTCMLSLYNPFITLLSYIVIAIILVNKNFRLLLEALLYPVFFPILHLYWGYHLILNLWSNENE